MGLYVILIDMKKAFCHAQTQWDANVTSNDKEALVLLAEEAI